MLVVVVVSVVVSVVVVVVVPVVMGLVVVLGVRRVVLGAMASVVSLVWGMLGAAGRSVVRKVHGIASRVSDGYRYVRRYMR